jgi:tyrosine-protein kinase Etk/Wzc
MVTSLQRGGGSTTLIATRAQILAKSGTKTVVVDAAFNHPSLHDVFGVDPGGLAEVFAGEATLEQAVSPTSVSGLHLLPAGLGTTTAKDRRWGPQKGAAAGEFEDQFLRRIIRTLSEAYDIVLVDSPPAACWRRPDVMSGLCDATILLAGAAQARDGTLRRAAAGLKRFGANVAGAVIAHAPADAAEPGTNDEVPASSGSESTH